MFDAYLNQYLTIFLHESLPVVLDLFHQLAAKLFAWFCISKVSWTVLTDTNLFYILHQKVLW